MSWQPSNDPILGDPLSCDALERVIVPRTREHLGPTDLGIMHFRKLIMDAARALQAGTPPSHLARQDRYAVRSGGCVTHKARDLPAVMIERFGDATGYVGRPRIAAAE